MQENISLEEPPGLAEALAMVKRPPPHTRMPAASLKVRLKTSPWLRRLLPTRLLVKRAELRGRALWAESPKAREQALATMAAIVGGTPQALQISEHARAHLIECEVDRALFWQPWPTSRIDEQSAMRLREALSGDRGVLLSACHIGPFYRAMSAVRALGEIPYAVAGPWFFEQPSPDLWGRRIARWRKGAVCRHIRSTGSFALLGALLERGKTVLSYLDVPGRRETHFLGKPATLADGIARLAVKADAPVLPTRARRVGHRVWVDVAAPIDPRDYEDVAELHEAVAAFHESWILEFPAAMAEPRSFGWGDGARPDAWTRPDPVDRAPLSG
jgi:lauroyl/myristoyl acyltransferase